jgi:uncharacterized protein YggU (UPF0235/DUF167 family)
MHDGVIKIRIAAPSVKNAANEALVDFVAGALSISKSSVRIVSGRASQQKLLEIDGDGKELAVKLGSLVAV